MTATEFKEKAIDLLEYCLVMTKETAKEDEIEDGDGFLEYCCGFEEAIEKIRGMEV